MSDIYNYYMGKNVKINKPVYDFRKRGHAHLAVESVRP